MKQYPFKRGAGVLCHIGSLPNEYGMGGLGKEAYEFADLLHKNHVTYWQILPLVQTGYGDSPYQSACGHSGNPYMIDLEDLQKRGLLLPEEVEAARLPQGGIDYGALYNTRLLTLRAAYARFDITDPDFEEFVKEGEFDDYALFMSLKSRFGVPFTQFPESFKYKEHLAIIDFRNSVYKTEYCFWLFVQYIFRQQWFKLKTYVNGLGISIIGDIPLYVAYDSSDVWGAPEMFCLDEDLNPTEVAGVPPDYFSRTGQLWGNPLYNWQAMASDGYSWWVERIAKAARLYDIVRIDHFRALDRYYSVPASAQTAMEGQWKDGPKQALFDAIENKLGLLPIISEDLGTIDDGVKKLRDDNHLLGMNILLFAFDGRPDNAYLPANMKEFSVTYTGTHDNDTAVGYLNNLGDETFERFKWHLRDVLQGEGVDYPFVTREECAYGIVVAALAAPSVLTIVPVQDMMGLDNGARLNTPGLPSGNWQFRLSDFPTREQWANLKKFIDLTHRN